MPNWFRTVYARYVALSWLKAFPKPQKKKGRTNNKTEFQIYPGAIAVKKEKKKKRIYISQQAVQK